MKEHVDHEVVHTGQLFFDDALTARLYRTNSPYDTRPIAETTNPTDSIFKQAGAGKAVLSSGTNGDDYIGTLTMDVTT